MSLLTLTARVRLAWAWFVDGLVEALVWTGRRGRRPIPFRLVIGETEGGFFNSEGASIGRFAVGDAALAIGPPDLVRNLTGHELDLIIPPVWMVRHNLEPIAAQSRPFLDVFVRHQIERISPWRADAVYHRILVEPLSADPTRLAVTVVLVPKRLIEPWISRLGGLGLTSLRLCSPETEAGAIRIGGDKSTGVTILRNGVSWGLDVLLAVSLLLYALFEWQAAIVTSNVADQNSVLNERKLVLAKARQRSGSGDGLTSKVLALRGSRASVVAIIDALAEAVPDSAHLTALSIDKDGVSISGLSTDPSALVPALESSGHFAGVTPSAATTRTEAGDADRFSLVMRALPSVALSTSSSPEREPRKEGRLR